MVAVLMRVLLVCQRDPKCVWSRIAAAKDDPKSIEAREKHYARHDLIEERRALKLAATSALRAEPAEKEAPSGSPKVSCVCCELGLFGVHGIGHVIDERIVDAA